MLHAIVHSAGIQDRDGGIVLLATLFGQFPFLAKLFADSAYQGPIFGNALAKILPCLETEIVKRSDQAKGFVQLPKRWIVERTIAWLNRCRRLAKDWENLNRNALAFLKLASRKLGYELLKFGLRPSATSTGAHVTLRPKCECKFCDIVSVGSVYDYKEVVLAGREIDLLDFNSHFLGQLLRGFSSLRSVLD